MHRNGSFHVGKFFLKSGLLGICELKRQSLPELWGPTEESFSLIARSRVLPNSADEAEALCHKLLQRDPTLARMRTIEQGLELVPEVGL
ncbi:MAG: hypothetical protein CM1200mP36_07370 [Gammaproteobacteria bacterium]|nr:MAG: hypothetical protein CM1200mP36_07370 [Gammaproteobacteria bacterium]